jgi:hypothetical protein
MKLFGFFAAFAAAQDFSVLTAAAEDLDKIVSSTTGNVKQVLLIPLFKVLKLISAR